jgi:hypothetical protein
MELITVNNHQRTETVGGEISSDIPFIQANTVPVPLQELKEKHIIPVFVKDNEPVISHNDFINCTQEVAYHVFANETINVPSVRVSHPIKGRIPEAKEKSAKELLEHEKTIYYERMAFVIEIPSITDTINGNKLSLTIGGVKAYNLDNLYNRKGAEERFKIFIGFQNKVCCNLCVWTDGLLSDLRVKNTNELMRHLYELFTKYSLEQHLNAMSSLVNTELTEHQFATFVGRLKLYQHLPVEEKLSVPTVKFGDNQLSMIAKDYYHDSEFCRNDDGSINLWNVYNLFTGANKASYIDTFLDRGENAFRIANHLEMSLASQQRQSWFLS